VRGFSRGATRVVLRLTTRLLRLGRLQSLLLHGFLCLAERVGAAFILSPLTGSVEFVRMVRGNIA